MVLLSLPLFVVVAEPDDLDYLIFVQILEAHTRDDVVVVLLCEEKAGLLESFAVEGVCILEDLANGLNIDVLGQDLLALLLEGADIEPVGELKRKLKSLK